jgi:SAM-dependent methyltransferase
LGCVGWEGSENNKMNLDVGCGHSPKGDVNIDLHIKATSHRNRTVELDEDLDTKKIPNFVKADANFLPFRPRMFKKVFMYEVLEHFDVPKQVLSEIRKVLTPHGVLILSIPNLLFWRCLLRWIVKGKITISAKQHINGWRLPEIENLMRVCSFNIIDVGFADVSPDPTSFFSRVLPRVTRRSMIITVTKELQ